MAQTKTIIIAMMIFCASVFLIATPSILPALGVSGNTTSFNVTLTVSSGSPTITMVDTISSSPNEGTTKVVTFYFNATHPNGVSNIPSSNAVVKINQSGVILNSTACAVNITDSVTLNRFACNITISYYHPSGGWTINATITDLAGNVISNTSIIYTMGTTYGITLKTNSLAFSGTSGQNNIEAQQYVNNTGNVAFSQINLTAYTLLSGSNAIGAGNFTANTTQSSGPGQVLVNGTPVTIASSALAVGAGSSKNVWIYADIPTGQANGTYTSSSAWVVALS